MTSIVRGAFLVAALLAIIPTRLGGQEENLLPHASPNVLGLYKAKDALQTHNPFRDPIAEAFSPDSRKIDLLDQAESFGQDYIRAAADLLNVYENLHCESDLVMMKPLLIDRLQLSSQLLSIDAQRPTILLGQKNLPAITERALKLRDDLLAAKSKVDAIAASLK